MNTNTNTNANTNANANQNTPNTSVPRTPTHTPTHNPLTFAAFQHHIRKKYYDTDSARGTPGTFMWFIEEVGELATTLHKIRGDGADTSGGSTHHDLESEFADVIAWLCTLANINNIDLENAIRQKYLDGAGPTGTK